MNQTENKARRAYLLARRAERQGFDASVEFRKGSVRATVRIVDISTDGARLSSVHQLRLGDTFWLRLPMLAPVEAKVVWVEEFVIGCQFAQPLHPAVLRTILAAA